MPVGRNSSRYTQQDWQVASCASLMRESLRPTMKTGIPNGKNEQFGDRHTWRLADIHPPSVISSDGFFYPGGTWLSAALPGALFFQLGCKFDAQHCSFKTQIYSSYKATYGADFLGGTSCSHKQESFDSDDEDTAVSFNNPTGPKTGDSKPTEQKVQQPHVPWHTWGCFSVKTYVDRTGAKKYVAIAVKSLQRRMALELGPVPQHISLITHWCCVSHFQGFRLRSPTQLENVSVLLSPSFLFTHLSRVAWISWLPAETTSCPLANPSPSQGSGPQSCILRNLKKIRPSWVPGAHWIPLVWIDPYDPWSIHDFKTRATLRIAFTLSVVFSKTAHAAAISAVATNANKMAETMRRSNCSIFTFLPQADRKLIQLIQPNGFTMFLHDSSPPREGNDWYPTTTVTATRQVDGLGLKFRSRCPGGQHSGLCRRRPTHPRAPVSAMSKNWMRHGASVLGMVAKVQFWVSLTWRLIE